MKERPMIKSIKKVSVTKRKDPLIDFNTLMTIGRHASRSAREKALSHGVSFTYAKDGRIMRRFPDGSEQFVRVLSDATAFPSLEADLCRD